MSGRRRKPHIRVRINRLRLHGFDPSQKQAIGRELQTSLTGLMRENGFSITSDTRRFDHSSPPEPIRIHDRADSASIGRQLAQRLYEWLQR